VGWRPTCSAGPRRAVSGCVPRAVFLGRVDSIVSDAAGPFPHRGAIHEALGSSCNRLCSSPPHLHDGSARAGGHAGVGRAVVSLRRPGDPGDLGGGRGTLAGLRTRPGDDGLDRAAPHRFARHGRRQRLGAGEVRGVGHRGLQGAVRHLAGLGTGDHPHRSDRTARAFARGHGRSLESGHGRTGRGGGGDPAARGQPRSLRGIAVGGARQVRAHFAPGAELPRARQPGVVRAVRDDGPHDGGARASDRGVERTRGEHGVRVSARCRRC